MMPFKIGGSKSKSKSSSSAESFIDQTQAPHLANIYNQAQKLGEQGMPVEGTAGLNQNLINAMQNQTAAGTACLLYTSPSPRDGLLSRMPSSA